jgi:hypothetical protein
MNRGLKILTVLLCSYLSITQLHAQVTGVRYQLKYDTTTCLYNVNLIIASGSATSVAHRTMFNAQISFVVPNTDSFEIVQRFMPLQSNGSYNGTIPMEWLISNTVLSPTAQPMSNFYAVIPTLTPTSQYNNLSTNDTIKLFSVRSFRRDGTMVKSCANNLRFFINGVDPNSSAPGMGGGDFNNGFTIGSAIQLYQSNIATAFPPKPALTFANNCSNNIDINLTAKSSACQKPLTYNWTGPGYFSTSEDVFIPSASAFNNGMYNVTVTDNLGCTSTLSIASEIKPNAGTDKMKCGTGSFILSATNPSSGTWTAQSGNPPNSTLGPTSGGNATANYNVGAAGIYNYIYSTAICKDTLSVTVASSLTPNITGANSLCSNATTTLTANGGTSYSWSNGTNSPTVNVGPGTYTVTATDANGCTGTTTKTITSLSLPTASITGANSVCSGNTTSISASGGNSYLWSNGNIASSINVGSGTYTVTVTNASGCTDTEQKIITIFSLPTATISGANAVCTGKTVPISASGGNVYLWNTGANTSSINAGNGTFTVTVTDINGCTDTEQKIISTFTLPTASISGVNSICTGSTTSITASGGNSYNWSTGSSSPTINISNGTFTVTVTDANGCTDTEQKIIAALGTPTAAIAGANAVCIGGTTSLTASGGVSYAWSSGANTPSINVPNGTYTVTVTNAGGCTDTEQKIISTFATPTATITGGIAVCSGATTPITASGGVSYAWSNGTNSSTINVSNGTFTVTVTDANGCTDTEQKILSLLAPPTASISGANSVCSGKTTALTASGGVSYAWSNGAITPSVNVSNGTFTVTVTNSDGCTDTEQKIISSVATPTAAIAGANAICAGATTSITASGGVSYSWNNGAISPSITVSNGTFTVTVTDANGCTDTEQKIINTNASPNAAISGANAVCVGGSTSITASGGISYTWSNGAITPSINVTNGTYTVTVTNAGGCTDTEQKIISTFATPTATITGGIAVCSGATTPITASGGVSYAWSNGTNSSAINVSNGTFTVTVTDANGCTDSEQKVISTLAPPTASISGANSVCSGKTTTLTASGGASYAWSNGANTPSVNISSGTFTVTVTNTDGCTDTEQKIISLLATPIAAISGANAICSGATTSITASGGVSYSWNNGAITPSITVSNGTFTVTVTDANGCTDTEQKIINTSPPPNATIAGANAVCIGGTTSLTASGGVSYVWSNGAITPSINVANGTYTVTVTNAGGCTDTEQKIISTFAAPTATITGGIAVCSGGNTTIIASGGISYAWSNGANTPSINASSGTFTVTVTDANGCKDTEQKVISTLAPPTASISGANSVCSGKTTTLTSSGGASYAWSNGANTPSVNVSNGTFTVTVTNTDGCTDTEQKVISLLAPPTAVISGANAICTGATTSITASGGVSYFWNNGAITPSITISNGTFTVTVTDANGCTDTEQKIINTSPPPNATIAGANAVCIGGTTSLTASGGVSYSWSNGSITPSINVANGTYTVTVTDAGGCTDTEQKIISTFAAPTATITGGIAVCSGATTTIIASGGVSYAWSNGANTPSINASSGTFTVTVTDANGCKDTEQKILSPLASPNVVISGANSVCSGKNISLTASGGFSYSWNTGANTPSVNVSNGTYTVTVTDTDGCTSSSQKTITSIVPPVATISGANTVCNGNTTSITATGGVSYSWNNGAITPSITVSIGTFTVTATDSNGCTDTESFTILENPLPIISAGGPYGPVCDDGANITLTGSPSGGTWSGNGVTDGAGASGSFNPSGWSGSGPVTVTYSYTDPVSGCSNTPATATIVVNTLPTLNVVTTVCSPDLSTYTISFTSNGTISSTAGTMSGNTVIGIPSGTNVTLTATNPTTGCDITLPVTAPNCACPAIEAPISSVGDTICFGVTNTALAATVPSGITIDWYAAPTGGSAITSNSATYTPAVTAAGDYIFYAQARELTSSCLSPTRTPVHFKINSLPVINAGGPYGPVCDDGANITLTGSPSGGTWSGSGVTDGAGAIGSFNPSGWSGLSPVTVTYSYTDPVSGCTNTPATATIVVNPLPTLSISSSVCSPDLSTYTISFTSNVTVSSTAGTVSGNTVIGIPSGTNVTLTATNPTTGCDMTLPVTAPDCACPVIPAPISPAGDTICFGATNTALAATVPSGITIDWYAAPTGGSAITSNSKTYTPAVTAAGDYIFYAQARELSSGCLSPTRTPVHFKINSLPVINAGGPYGPVCEDGANITLTGSPSGGTWSGNGVTDGAGAIGSFNPSGWSGSGPVTVIYSYTDPVSGCSNTPATATIVVNPLPTLSISSSVCSPDLTTYTISFTSNATVSSSAGTVSGNTVIGIPSGTNVTLTATNPTTGCDMTLPVTAPNCACPAIAAPTLPIGDTICLGAANTAVSANVPTGITIDWYAAPTGGSAIISNSATYTPAVTTAGDYIFYAQARELTSGCLSPTRTPVHFKINPEPTLSVSGTVCSADLLTYTITFVSNGTVSSTVGTVSGNTVIGIPSGTNVTLTATNPTTGCDMTLPVTAPNCACPAIAAPTLPIGDTICLGAANTAVSANVPIGITIDWYAAPTGGSAMISNSTTYTPAVTATGDYIFYAQARELTSGCLSPTRTPVHFKINSLPVINAGGPYGPICEDGANITLTGSPSGGTWSGNGVTDGAGAIGSFNPSGWSSSSPVTVTYSYTDPVSGCTNTPATATIVVNPLPTLSISSSVCSPDLTTYTISFTSNATVSSSSGTVSGNTVIGIPSGTNVTLTATNPTTGCDMTLPVTAPNCACPAIAAPTLPIGDTICLGAANTAVSANVPTGITIDWYAAPTGGSAIISNSATYTPAVTTAGDYIFYAQARELTSGCLSPTRTPVHFKINPEPTLSVSGTVCSADLLTYTITFVSNGTVSSTVGTVSGNTVIGIPSGTNVTLTATNPTTGCDMTLPVTAPNCACPAIAAPTSPALAIPSVWVRLIPLSSSNCANWNNHRLVCRTNRWKCDDIQ